MRSATVNASKNKQRRASAVLIRSPARTIDIPSRCGRTDSGGEKRTLEDATARGVGQTDGSERGLHLVQRLAPPDRAECVSVPGHGQLPTLLGRYHPTPGGSYRKTHHTCVAWSHYEKMVSTGRADASVRHRNLPGHRDVSGLCCTLGQPRFCQSRAGTRMYRNRTHPVTGFTSRQYLATLRTASGRDV